MSGRRGFWGLYAVGSAIWIRIASLALVVVVSLTGGGGCSSKGSAVDARIDVTTDDAPGDGGGGDRGDIRGGDAGDALAEARGDDAMDGPAGMDGRASDVVDGRMADSCRLPLDAAQPFSSCLPTFDDDTWRTHPCFLFRPAITEQICTGYRSRRFDYGTHSWTCYYDPGAGTLVAGVFVDDVNTFCNGSAYIVTLGEVPTAATCAAPIRFAEPCVSADGG